MLSENDKNLHTNVENGSKPGENQKGTANPAPKKTTATKKVEKLHISDDEKENGQHGEEVQHFEEKMADDQPEEELDTPAADESPEWAEVPEKKEDVGSSSEKIGKMSSDCKRAFQSLEKCLEKLPATMYGVRVSKKGTATIANQVVIHTEICKVKKEVKRMIDENNTAAGHVKAIHDMLKTFTDTERSGIEAWKNTMTAEISKFREKIENNGMEREQAAKLEAEKFMEILKKAVDNVEQLEQCCVLLDHTKILLLFLILVSSGSANYFYLSLSASLASDQLPLIMLLLCNSSRHYYYSIGE
uniref:Uncharacterized protein n=1 Tax=Caenorhabditis japonica TaxID=281687 RepID=A0A8R1I9W2_CAEJA